MVWITTIVDSDTHKGGKISKRGQFITAPLDFSTPTAGNPLITPNVAFNFREPRPRQVFIITEIILSTDNSISANGAEVTIYEATSIDSTIVDSEILTVTMPSRTIVPLLGLNWIGNENRWINAKTDDATVNVTLGGYYATA